MPDAAYYRAWRAAHPEYRKRQAQLRAERRRRNGRDRQKTVAEGRPSRAVRLPEIPALHLGHPLFDQARAFVTRRPSALQLLHDPFVEDLVSEAVLALVEGTDPRKAVNRFDMAERTWRRMTCELLEVAAA